MKLKFHDKSIDGILAIVPKDVKYFDDEIANYEFAPETSRKLKDTMGYNAHRVVKPGTTVSDMAVAGFEYLFDNNLLKADAIDALILVTETPDYIIPPTSNVIAGRLGLGEDIICLDINQGCAGFEIGLIESFMLLEQDAVNTVALVNAETLSHRTSMRDRNSYPLIGDAAAITVVRKSKEPCTIYANVKMDGSGAFAIQIPAGGIKLPCSPETAIPHRDEHGNWRSAENLTMKGDEVFMFVQKRVPPLITEIMEYSGTSVDSIDGFMFHQPNSFMLNKLARKLKIPADKLPVNIVANFGNSSSVTVPLNIAFNLGAEITHRRMQLCMSGFGIGLVWSAIVMPVGPLDFCKLMEVDL